MKTPLYLCRKKAGFSLEQLAMECGTSTPTLSRIERGMSKNTSGATCLELINRLGRYGLTLDNLINPEKYPNFITKE
ncbi:helix-turn-helix domain-containing protein [Vibrio cholerae]|uniref:helix-turn-helix domain-containing protein n=1 Tax=Gammaproteobacteria TaxID=1236 RepID=UPI001E31AA68|nr:helix-turn-helix transcriptional regulator [Vibrio cholerae]EGR0659857.1 XRE family transcriptional regulator [Vibrio cholerae]EGR0939090.1 XRE family transcriptional regulator [Vibrio cholerae]EJL6636821.1 helix-turn-helix transcriptional regulator [Vibrio cholerae]EJS1626316.1 helix-turn-helix transcriptional regulator [Vibrio cholerae]MCD1245860.1 hypothetical protein [Vibrio cholerae]